ncbi:carbohydrate-binding family 9-like protein [Sphingobacterium corticibacter]|uniref:Carbohydrate-binding domain-containing protein n=1 Tax=Sphingobacterium corticibacter TaxID=2171749 RepID=A0A2T8HMQ3_9SPHI|nr:carbohydrate-binding family 9-like protein [Sphingobacterium corticibacter]PVH26717.1 hypothetical protein DC487_03665 [Sphingobacterium corticibacter]
MLLINFISARVQDWQSYHDAVSVFSESEWQVIDSVNWPAQFSYAPTVRFQAMYSAEFLLLHYAVEEEFVRACAVRHNEAVYEDSCVECFISFDEKKTYFNIEFNLLGTGLIGHRSTIYKEKKRLDVDLVNRVSTFTNVQQIAGKKNWQMIMAIPFEILGQDGTTLSGKSAHANFYKCGDQLPVPHYLSWKPIDTPQPTFHKVEYFGEIVFL